MRSRQALLAAAAALAVVLGAPGPPAMACDSSSCLLVTRGQSGLVPKGMLRVDLSFRQTDLTERMRGSDESDRVLRPKIDFERGALRPGYHDELGGHDRFLQVDLAYGVGARTMLLTSIPVLARRAFDIGHPPALAESYVTTGNGDLLLGVRHGIPAGSSGSLVAGLSLEAPLGRHRLESPASRSDRGILDPTLQPGSGSFDLVGSLLYAHRLAGPSLDVTGSASYQRNGTNDLDHRVGDDAIVSLTVARPLAGRVSGTLQIKWTRRARSTFRDEDVPSTGGRVAYLTPGLSTKVGTRASVYGFLTLPVSRYVNEEQLAPRRGFVLGVSRSF
jgi:hypothetical protein